MVLLVGFWFGWFLYIFPKLDDESNSLIKGAWGERAGVLYMYVGSEK